EFGVGLGRQRDHDHGDLVVRILEAEEALTGLHSRRRHQAEGRAGGVADLGGAQRCGAGRKREQRKGSEERADSCHGRGPSYCDCPTENMASVGCKCTQTRKPASARSYELLELFPGTVTRRSVRLIRPPSGSRVELPGMIRSTPWKASRAA